MRRNIRQTSVNAVGRLFTFPARGPGKRENDHGDTFVLASDGLWYGTDPLDGSGTLYSRDNIEKITGTTVAWY